MPQLSVDCLLRSVGWAGVDVGRDTFGLGEFGRSKGHDVERAHDFLRLWPLLTGGGAGGRLIICPRLAGKSTVGEARVCLKGCDSAGPAGLETDQSLDFMRGDTKMAKVVPLRLRKLAVTSRFHADEGASDGQ